MSTRPARSREATALAELIGAPIFECYASEYNVPASHPLNLGSVNFVTPKDIRATLADCDVLMVVGAPLFQLIFPEPERSVLSPDTQGRPARQLRPRARQERAAGRRHCSAIRRPA